MSVDPFKATSIQVNQLLNALTADTNGNLIFADVPNQSGVTLSQLVGIANYQSKNYNIDIPSDQLVLTAYTFSDGTYFGYGVVIQHDLKLTNKNTFTVRVSANGRQVDPQEVLAIDTNSFSLIMPDTTPVNVTLIGF